MAQRLMNCTIFGVAVSSIALCWGAPLALANQSPQDNQQLEISVENYTSMELLEFYAIPVDNEEWGEDLLGEDTLPPVAAFQINLNMPPTDCLYDILGVFGEGDNDSVEEYGVNLCDLQGGTYAFYDETDQVFRVENQTSVPITGFYFTPASQDSWGINLFELSDGGYELQAGEAVEVPVNSSECEYDFRAEFADDTESEQFGINVCNGDPGVTFVNEEAEG